VITRRRKLLLVALCLAASLLAAALVTWLRLEQRCPAGTAAVTSGRGIEFCIHRHEASRSAKGFVFVAGRRPADLLTWTEARAACERLGGWLCTSAQWEDACDGVVGPGGSRYPYGDTYEAGRCATGDKRGAALKQPVLTGSRKGCVSAFGVHDMAGNLWEWADPQQEDSAGAPQTDKRGGAHYMDGRAWSSCKENNPSHPPGFRASITFRCCFDPRREW